MKNAGSAPVIWWVRRDLRLADNPALEAALASDAPVIPVFLLDEVMEALGAAPKWRFGLGVEVFGRRLADMGSRLTLRRGGALETLRSLVAETGARAVVWSRAYDPDQISRDGKVKAGLLADGLDVRSLPGHLLFEPWTVKTGTGGYYKVYSPMWKSVRGRELDAPLPPPAGLPVPDVWPTSDDLVDWNLSAAMGRGAAVVANHVCVGETAARDRLDSFVEDRINDYAAKRDIPGIAGTSRLSENLAYGEISPRNCWHAGWRAVVEGKSGAETFLKELVWREFAYHLVYHTPHITDRNWRDDWNGFPWRDDNTDAELWRRGCTGIPFVDAGMREMYVTGTMHNRARMIAASLLTKHLLTDWRVGLEWFADCLIDWDPASNAMGWQWAAGSGPDAAPYFRIFNPETQLKKFDPDGRYAGRFIAEGRMKPEADALAFFEATPRSWNLDPEQDYPLPVVDLAKGRLLALEAYNLHRVRRA